jgi:hypothetical protein
MGTAGGACLPTRVFLIFIRRRVNFYFLFVDAVGVGTPTIEATLMVKK